MDTLTWPPGQRAVIVAPHPDDETLALGGSMRDFAAVTIVAVTDGEASHPARRAELPARRAEERRLALERLGVEAVVVRLGFPDGGVADMPGLAEKLVPLLAGATICFAPWPHDGHPDHDATGAAAARACDAARLRLVWYPIWALARGLPLPAERLRRVILAPAARAAKRHALAAFRSQLEGDDPVVPPAALAHFLGPHETVLV